MQDGTAWLSSLGLGTGTSQSLCTHWITFSINIKNKSRSGKHGKQLHQYKVVHAGLQEIRDRKQVYLSIQAK